MLWETPLCELRAQVADRQVAREHLRVVIGAQVLHVGLQLLLVHRQPHRLPAEEAGNSLLAEHGLSPVLWDKPLQQVRVGFLGSVRVDQVQVEEKAELSHLVQPRDDLLRHVAPGLHIVRVYGPEPLAQVRPARAHWVARNPRAA